MRSNLLLALIVAFPLILNAQKNGRRGNSKWPALQELVIPDSLKDETAFYILNTTTIDFLETYETEVVVYKRIYVNSEKAAEEMNQKELFVSNGGRITMLQARTIKKDGSIIELDGEQIIETESIQKNKYGTDVLRRIQLIYPNVEKGDIIDLAYERSLDGYIFSDLMFLEDDLPSLRTKISLRNISRLDLTVYNLHGMPATKRSLEGGVETISWEKYGVNKRVSEDYSAIHPEASCGVFVLWKRGEKLDYKTIYSFDAYKYPETFGVFYKITERLQELGILEAEEQAFVALPKLIKAFENDFKWNVDESTEELKETIKFLSDKKVDDVLFLRYIMKYLSEQGIRYEKGFSKSLLDGRFEHGLVSLEQLSRRFLFIYDENDQVHFLFPPTGDGEFYYMDEIPFYLEGNQSIALYGDGDFLKETGTVAIP